MPSVDNRVVEMRFDNKDFESDIGTSINSLEKLKKSLNLKDAAEGLDEIEKASRKLDFSSVADAADAVTNKFSVLGTIGDQILRRIGDSIYDVQQKAIGLVKSLSTDQISAGWNKYAQKTTAVQTIMAATAKDYSDEAVQMADVNDQLEKLSWFTDETSYNFVDMTSNIGKFTSNGQKLADSVTAMQGISTWAAISGANAGEASRAMYNLSQALSVGAVKLMDWKSIENANMSTVEFKETAMETAAAMGMLTKTSDGVFKTLKGNEVTVQSFNQNLSDAWFTSDVLMATLDKYGGFTNELYNVMGMVEEAGSSITTSKMLEYVEDYQNGVLNFGVASKQTGLDAETLEEQIKKLASSEYDLGRRAFKAAQEAKTFEEAIDATKDAVSSGWMQTFEYIFGGYTDAKKLWTKVANELWDVFAGGAATRNQMLKEWHENGGYDALWKAVSNMWEGLKGIGARIGDVWRAIFPNIDANKLIALSNRFLAFSERFKSAFEYVEDAVEEVAEPITETVETVSTAVEQLFDVEDLAWRVMQGEFGNGSDRVSALESMAEGLYGVVQDLVNLKYYGIVTHLGDASQLAAEATENLTESEDDLLMAEKKWRHQQTIEPIEKTRTVAEDLSSVLRGLGSVIQVVIAGAKLLGQYVVLPVLKGALKALRGLLGFIAPFGDAFGDFIDKLKESDTIGKNLEILRNWFADLKEQLAQSENVQKLLGYWESFKDWINGIKTDALNRLTTFFDNVANSEIQLPSVEKVAGWIDTAVGHINTFIETIEEGWPQVRAFFENLDFSDVENFASSASSAVSTFFQNLFSDDELKETGRNWLNSLIDGVVESASNTNWSTVISAIMKGLAAAIGTSVGFGFADVLFGLGKLERSGATIPGKLVGVLTGVQQVLKGYSWDLKADALLKVAGAIGIFAVSMIALSMVNTEKLASVAGALIPIIGVLIALAAVIGKYWGTNGGIGEALDGHLVEIGKLNVKLPKLGITIGAFGVLLLGLAAVIGSVVAALKLVDPKAFFLALLGVMGVIAVMSLCMKELGGIKGEYAHAGAGLLIMAIALDALIPIISTLTLLAHFDWKSLAIASGALVVIMLAMSGALRLAGDVKANAIKGILVMAVGIAAIGAVLSVMSKISWKKLLPAAAILLGFIAALAAISYVMSLIPGMDILLLAFGAAIALVGASMVLAGVGALAFAKAIELVAKSGADMKKAGKNLAEGIVAFFDVLMAEGDSIVAFFSTIVTAIIAAISLKKANITQLGADFITWLGSGLASKKGVLIGLVLLLAGVVLEALDLNLEYYAGKLILLLSKLINDIANAIIANEDVIRLAVDRVIWTMFYVIEKSIAGFFEKHSGLLDFFREIRFLWLTALDGTTYSDMSEYTAAFEDWKRMNPSSLSSHVEEIAMYLNRSQDEFETAYQRANENNEQMKAAYEETEDILSKPLFFGLPSLSYRWVYPQEMSLEQLSQALGVPLASDLDDIGYDFISGTGRLAGVLVSQKEQIEEESNGMLDGIFNFFSGVGDRFFDNGQDSGADYGLGFAEGVGMSEGDVQEAVELLGLNSEEFLRTQLQSHSPSEVTKAIGKDYDSGFALGIRDNRGTVRPPVRILISTALQALATIKEKARPYGRYFDEGFALGIEDYASLVYKAVQSIGKESLEKLKESIDSGSPSKESRLIGNFFGQGFALGINDQAKNAGASAQDAGMTALDGIRAVVKRISDAINGDFDSDMTIRPVLDLSEIQNGASRIGGMFSGINLTPSIGYARNVAATVGGDEPSRVAVTKAAPVIHNNFYVQKMDEGMVDYFVARVNSELGARA